MAWHLTDSVDEFLREAGDFLRSRPAEHTIPLSLVDTLRARGPHFYGADDPIFGWWQDGSGVRGAFLRTPPYPLFVTSAPDVPALVDLLGDQPLSGVSATAGDAEAFAEIWATRTGRRATPGMRTRLFRLGELTSPPPPPGTARVAGPADRDLLAEWMTAFFTEIGEPGGSDMGEMVDDKLSYGGLLVWDVDGEPVSMAAGSRLSAGMVRVLTVYTPKESRGRGYAGAVTVAVSRAALDAGADAVVLYTDLGNPTSNALYPRLGYRPVEDRVVMEFHS